MYFIPFCFAYLNAKFSFLVASPFNLVCWCCDAFNTNYTTWNRSVIWLPSTKHIREPNCILLNISREVFLINFLLSYAIWSPTLILSWLLVPFILATNAVFFPFLLLLVTKVEGSPFDKLNASTHKFAPLFWGYIK